jgi:hypothetical protein
MIVFGALMGSMFIGQQFLQNVLGYSTLSAGLAVLPAAVGMMGVSGLSARLVLRRGSRDTILAGYVLVLLSFATMLMLWGENTPYLPVGAAYLLIGVGAGLALAPASRSLTSSVPVAGVGMASGTSDLQRDLGGSVMQAILGSLLTVGYAASLSRTIGEGPQADQVSEQTQATLTASYSSAQNLAEQYPQYADQIVAAAKASFLTGSNWAYLAACVAALLGAALVAWRFPGKAGENDLLAQYAQQDAVPGDPSGEAAPSQAAPGR